MTRHVVLTSGKRRNTRAVLFTVISGLFASAGD